jgi:hypothetical protein
MTMNDDGESDDPLYYLRYKHCKPLRAIQLTHTAAQSQLHEQLLCTEPLSAVARPPFLSLSLFGFSDQHNQVAALVLESSS